MTSKFPKKDGGLVFESHSGSSERGLIFWGGPSLGERGGGLAATAALR